MYSENRTCLYLVSSGVTTTINTGDGGAGVPVRGWVGGALAANVKPVMKTVGFISGSWDALFGQGHKTSELVDSTGRRHQSALLFFWICLCRRWGLRRKSARFLEEVTCWVNADEVGVTFEDGKSCSVGLGWSRGALQRGCRDKDDKNNGHHIWNEHNFDHLVRGQHHLALRDTLEKIKSSFILLQLSAFYQSQNPPTQKNQQKTKNHSIKAEKRNPFLVLAVRTKVRCWHLSSSC